MFCFSSSFWDDDDWKKLYSSEVSLSIHIKTVLHIYIYIGHSPVKSGAIMCKQGLDKSYYLIIRRSLIVVVFFRIYCNYCFLFLNSTTTIAITAAATITTATAMIYCDLLRRTLLIAARKWEARYLHEKWIRSI